MASRLDKVLTELSFLVLLHTFRNNVIILGENNSNLPRIFDIMATVFHKQVLKPDCPVYNRMLDILRQVQVSTLGI